MKRLHRIILRAALGLAAMASIAMPALTQTSVADAPASSKAVLERKNKAPINKEVLKVTLPKPVRATLDNGARVLVLEDHRLPTVTMQMIITGAGGLFEPKDRVGLAAMTAQMMRQGTATRDSKQLAEQIDALGASISVSAGAGGGGPRGGGGGGPRPLDATLHAQGLSENFDQWFAIATDVLLHPSFPAAELDRLRTQGMAMLRQQRSQATFLASERMQKVLYGEHPAAIVTPTAETLKAITTDDLKTWHDQRYVPQNTIIAIAGDVKASEMIAKLNKALASWKKTDAKVAIPAAPAPATAAKIYLVDRPGSVQTNLLLGNLAIDRTSPDYVALRVLNQVFGGGSNGRLFRNIREEKGYTYGAYSRLEAGHFAGPWVANSEVRSAVSGPALREFFYELKRLADEPVPADELEAARRSMVASFALSLESPASILSYAVQSEQFGFPADYWETYPTKIMAVTAADVQRVAKKYYGTQSVQVIAVGDAAKIRADIEKYGPVDVYDIAGQPVTGAAATGK